VGDPLGQEATHSIAACMGGIRTAGDLVLRMQMTHKMRINEAKQFIADKLGVTLEQLCDPVFMSELRDERGFGTQEPYITNANTGMEAKFRISEELGLKINSVERFKERAGLK
jgi:dimethylamine--corrinoid protein Co-methyltransferase